MHIGVLAQVLQLILLVVGVYGNADRAYLGAGVQERKPVRHVLCPQTYVCSFGNTYCNKAACHVIDPLVELFPGKTEVAVRVDNVFFVRGHLSPMLKPIAQSSF